MPLLSVNFLMFLKSALFLFLFFLKLSNPFNFIYRYIHWCRPSLRKCAWTWQRDIYGIGNLERLHWVVTRLGLQNLIMGGGSQRHPPHDFQGRQQTRTLASLKYYFSESLTNKLSVWLTVPPVSYVISIFHSRCYT